MQQRKRNKNLDANKRVKVKNIFFSLRNKSLNSIFPRRIAPVFLVIGIALFFSGSLYKIHEISKLSFDGKVIRNEKFTLKSDSPVSISIPVISVNLPIEETVIKNGIWQIGENGVSHLSSSDGLGANGNAIFYAHNTVNRLGKLQSIKMGDKIFLKSKSGLVYIYKVTDISVVDPTDLKKLEEYNGQMITIYTCTGFADLKRLLVKAQRETIQVQNKDLTLTSFK